MLAENKAVWREDIMKQIVFRTSENARKFQAWIKAKLDIRVEIYDLPGEEE
jgi:hypothetical protein